MVKDPPADRDGDGIEDDSDRCPALAGPRDNLGCPDRDEDSDGIVDRLDVCPSVPGVAGEGGAHGCPGANAALAGNGAAQGGTPPQQQIARAPSGRGSGSQGAGRGAAQGAGAAQGSGVAQAGGKEGAAWLQGRHFRFAEVITFDPATPQLTSRGAEIVAAVARVLAAHPEHRRVVIEGHVDEPGNTAARARTLSQQRAEAVKDALVRLGIDAARVGTRGFGYSQLLDRSETPAAQKINNRIEIILPE